MRRAVCTQSGGSRVNSPRLRPWEKHDAPGKYREEARIQGQACSEEDGAQPAAGAQLLLAG